MPSGKWITLGTLMRQAASTFMPEFPSIPYPPIEKLGLIGDRRTAALVAADGTLVLDVLAEL